MGGAVFAALFVTTATVLGLDVIIYDWTEFVLLTVLLVFALFLGRSSANKPHTENFDSDFMIAGATMVEIVIVGIAIVFGAKGWFEVNLLFWAQGHELIIRIFSIIVTMLIGYKIGQLKEETPTEF